MHYQQSVKNTKRMNVSPGYFGKGLTLLALLNIARKKIIFSHTSWVCKDSRNGAFYQHKYSIVKNTNPARSNWTLHLVQYHVLATGHNWSFWETLQEKIKLFCYFGKLPMWSLWILHRSESDQNSSQITSWSMLALCLAFAARDRQQKYRSWSSPPQKVWAARQSCCGNATCSSVPLVGLNAGIPPASASPCPRLPMGSLRPFAKGCQARAPPNQAVLRARLNLWQLA